MAGVPRDPRGRVILTVAPLVGGLADGAEPGADLGPGVAVGAQALDRLGAGDGNRARTVSLGIGAIRALIWPDLQDGLSVSDRESPRVTRVNGPANGPATRSRRGLTCRFQAWQVCKRPADLQVIRQGRNRLVQPGWLVLIVVGKRLSEQASWTVCPPPSSAGRCCHLGGHRWPVNHLTARGGWQRRERRSIR